MPSLSREVVRVPYGRTEVASAGPEVALVAGAPLRLCDGPYPFAEPPDLIGLATRDQRLALLGEHLASLCAPWDPLARAFLDAYFAGIAATLAREADALAALAARSGGLFAPEDWSFAALRPLPQAHLAAGAGAPVRVDFAFWTGAGFVAIALEGSATARKQRLEELARIVDSGVVLVRVPGLALKREGADALARLLPRAFHRFWEGVLLPSSPFGPDALDLA
jgi:hypothetical protein